MSGRSVLDNVTLSGNQVERTGIGGAIVAPDGALRLSSSLVGGNAAAEGDDEIAGEPVVLWPSLVGVDGRLVFAETAMVAPGIFGGVLADNGGPTSTIALLNDLSNPAIGAGSPSLAGTRDQRGISRDADPELGAIEAFDVVPRSTSVSRLGGISAETTQAPPELAPWQSYGYSPRPGAAEPYHGYIVDLEDAFHFLL